MLEIKLSPRDRIKKARVRLLRNHPFFGYALMHVSIVSNDEPKPPGPKIVYNEKFVESLDDRELEGVLCHELLHYLLGHIQRAKMMKKKLSSEADKQYYARRNIAEDIVVNAILIKNGFVLPKPKIKVENGNIEVKQGAIVPQLDYATNKTYVILRDAKGRKYEIWEPENKSAEEVYWEIRDFAVPESCSGSGDNDTMYFTDDTTDESNDGGEQSGNGQNGDKEKQGGGCFPSPKSPQELLSAAYTYAKMQGKEPAGFERQFRIALKPKVDWRILRRYVINMIPYDYSYFKPSKKSPDDIILPGVVKGEHLEALIAVDTSGSISEEELSDFMSEIHWLARNYRSIKFTLVSCDARIQTEEEIRSKFDLRKFKPRGGGGTDFRPVFDLAAKRRSKLIIFFTDGYGDFPTRPPKIPTIWIVSKSGAPESHFPFGKVLKM